MKKPTRDSLRFAAGAVSLSLLAAAIVGTMLRERERGEVPPPAGPVQVIPPKGASTTPSRSPFQEEAGPRPLPVSMATGSHEWTAGDASELHVIEQIAHNPEEALRMIEENDRIHRRQLVYRNETAAAAVQRAMAKGEVVRQLTLPGLDGRELEFVIERADLAPSGQTGSFTGHLAGKPNSQVSLAFKFGREAFTVISPDDRLYLQADPREPGEIIVKSIDPKTYIQGTCGNPNH